MKAHYYKLVQMLEVTDKRLEKSTLFQEYGFNVSFGKPLDSAAGSNLNGPVSKPWG